MAKEEITVKTIRNMFLWQNWIQILWDWFPNFKDIFFTMVKKRDRFDNLREVFKDDTLQESMDAVTYDDLSNVKATQVDMRDTLNKFKSASNKALWWIQKHLVDALQLSNTEILTTAYFRQKLPSNQESNLQIPILIKHIIQFMTYISATEADLTKNIKILQSLKHKGCKEYRDLIGT